VRLSSLSAIVLQRRFARPLSFLRRLLSLALNVIRCRSWADARRRSSNLLSLNVAFARRIGCIGDCIGLARHDPSRLFSTVLFGCGGDFMEGDRTGRLADRSFKAMGSSKLLCQTRGAIPSDAITSRSGYSIRRQWLSVTVSSGGEPPTRPRTRGPCIFSFWTFSHVDPGNKRPGSNSSPWPQCHAAAASLRMMPVAALPP